MHTGRWPRLLKPGGTIGICSPAGATRSAERMAAGVAAFEALGYRVVVAENALATDATRDYLAGTEAQRLTDLNALIRDPSVDLILAARGGYGAMKLLDGLDYDALTRAPKPVVGYSDITALSLAVAARTGGVSFSGVMVTAGDGFGQATLDPFSAASFWQAVTEGPFPRVFARPDSCGPWTVHRGPEVVSGPVFPVCLTLLNSLLGTPYVPDLTGAILVIEDVGEPLYAVDRYLTQLRLAGVLDTMAGVLIGSFNGVEGEDEALAGEVPRLVLEMTPESVAVASGVAYGHIPCRLTLPFGAFGTVDLRSGSFQFFAP